MAEVGCSYSISIGLFVCFFLSRKSTLSKLVAAFEFSFESTVGNQSQYLIKLQLASYGLKCRYVKF